MILASWGNALSNTFAPAATARLPAPMATLPVKLAAAPAACLNLLWGFVSSGRLVSGGGGGGGSGGATFGSVAGFCGSGAEPGLAFFTNSA